MLAASAAKTAARLVTGVEMGVNGSDAGGVGTKMCGRSRSAIPVRLPYPPDGGNEDVLLAQ